MSKEITRRSTLLDCLDYQTRWLKMSSKGRQGREPIDGLEDEFYEREAKCRILRELIHACESEPVRAAMAEWQIRLMKGEKPNTKDLEEPA